MGIGVPRVHANGLLKVFSSVLELTLRKTTIAQVVVGLPVQFVAFRRPLIMSHSPVIVSWSLEGQTREIVSFCVIRQVFESLQRQPVCFFQFASPAQHLRRLPQHQGMVPQVQTTFNTVCDILFCRLFQGALCLTTCISISSSTNSRPSKRLPLIVGWT